MFESIRVAKRSALSSEVIVLAYFQGTKPDGKSLGLGDVKPINEAAARPEATGEAGSMSEAFVNSKGGAKRVILLGLGKAEGFETGTLRHVAGVVGRRLIAVKAANVGFAMDAVVKTTKSSAFDVGTAIGEGLGLLGWVCDQFRGKATTLPARPKLTVNAESAFADGLERGLALGESTNFCRTLSQTPPNIATPAWMAEQAKKLARKVGLNIKVFQGQDLVRERFEGLINVGKASENKPCMIRLEYAPRGSSGKKPLVLVGKTMTYDTGGLSLKISNGMVGMKRDKDGGCAVLGAMHAIATTIKPNRRVVALLAVAENSVSDEAYRPDDVLTYRNGVTVEVTNTDAEGRLVLADALCWACEKEEPQAIIDLATLTGGVVTALGSTYAGMFCDDDKLRAKVETAAGAAGERVWRLPMHAEYRDMMKSPIADILNSNPNRKAHAGQGAAFLSYFVTEKTPWCHLDIAGVHVIEKNAGAYIDGPAGWGVRLLANLAEDF